MQTCGLAIPCSIATPTTAGELARSADSAVRTFGGVITSLGGACTTNQQISSLCLSTRLDTVADAGSPSAGPTRRMSQGRCNLMLWKLTSGGGLAGGAACGGNMFTAVAAALHPTQHCRCVTAPRSSSSTPPGSGTKHSA